MSHMENEPVRFGKLKGKPHSDFCLPENKASARWVVTECTDEKFKGAWDFIQRTFPDSVKYIKKNVDTSSNEFRSVGKGKIRSVCMGTGIDECKSDEKYRYSTNIDDCGYRCPACSNIRQTLSRRQRKLKACGLVYDPVVRVLKDGEMPLGNPN